METVNALTMRQSLGAVLDRMTASQKPVIVTRDRKPAAALVPYALFCERFVDALSEEEVDRFMARLDALTAASTGGQSLKDLRALRSGG